MGRSRCVFSALSSGSEAQPVWGFPALQRTDGWDGGPSHWSTFSPISGLALSWKARPFLGDTKQLLFSCKHPKRGIAFALQSSSHGERSGLGGGGSEPRFSIQAGLVNGAHFSEPTL